MISFIFDQRPFFHSTNPKAASPKAIDDPNNILFPKESLSFLDCFY